MSQTDYIFDRNEFSESISSISNVFRVEFLVDVFIFDARMTNSVKFSVDVFIFDARMTNSVKFFVEFFLIFSAIFDFSIVEFRFSDFESRTNIVERRDDSKFNNNDIEHDSIQKFLHDLNQTFEHSENFEIDIHSVFAHLRHNFAVVKQKQIKKFNKNIKIHVFKIKNIVKIIISERYRVVETNRFVFFERITRIIKIIRQHTIQTKFDVLNRRFLIKKFDVFSSTLNKFLKNNFSNKSKKIIMKQLTKYQFKSKQKQISCKCKFFSCFSRCICQKHDKRYFIYCHDVDQKCDNIVEKFEFQQHVLMNRVEKILKTLEK